MWGTTRYCVVLEDDDRYVGDELDEEHDHVLLLVVIVDECLVAEYEDCREPHSDEERMGEEGGVADKIEGECCEIGRGR